MNDNQQAATSLFDEGAVCAKTSLSIGHLISLHFVPSTFDLQRRIVSSGDSNLSMEPQLSEEHGVRIAVEGCVCFRPLQHILVILAYD